MEDISKTAVVEAGMEVTNRCERIPMEVKKVLGIDTSVINKLTKAAEGPAILAGIKILYEVRLPFPVVSEVISVEGSETRKSLLYTSNQLRRCGQIITAPHDILRLLVDRYVKGLAISPVRNFNLRFPEAEDELTRDTFDDIADLERQENYDNKKLFDEIYTNVKPAFDRMRAEGKPLPESVPALVSGLQAGGSFWNLAKNLMDRASTHTFDDRAVKTFYADCDAFRAFMIGLVVPQYDRYLKPKGDPSLRTGRNDTLMALYLPCFDEFVTNDRGQAACYREVVAAGRLDVKITFYKDFADRLMIAA